MSINRVFSYDSRDIFDKEMWDSFKEEVLDYFNKNNSNMFIYWIITGSDPAILVSSISNLTDSQAEEIFRRLEEDCDDNDY